MNRSFSTLLAIPLLSIGSMASAGDCKSVATARPEPPASQGLYPLRILRADTQVADSTDRQEMFKGTRYNGPTKATEVFTAPPVDPMLQMRTKVPLAAGKHVLQVVEQIPSTALSSVAARDRRKANNPRAKTLEIAVEAGQEYALAARLLPDTANRTLSNAHWEPVVWRQEALDCQ